MIRMLRLALALALGLALPAHAAQTGILQPPQATTDIGSIQRADCIRITSPTVGSICFDQTANALKFWNGSQWVAAFGLPTGVAPVTDTGAVCNGTTNDTERIQAAINAGNIQIPAGKVCISGPLLVPSDRWIFGPGILKLKANSDAAQNAHLIANAGGYTNENSNIHIRNLILDGNRANQTGNHGSRGIYFEKAVDWDVVGCIFSNWFTDGIYASGFTLGSTANPDVPGESTDAPGRFVISGNRFYNIGSTDITKAGYAIHLDYGAYQASITGNVIDDSTYGIVAGVQSHDIAISGNSVTVRTLTGLGNTSVGIGITQHGHRVSVTGNTIFGTYYGMNIEASVDSTVSGNTIKAVKYDGIEIYDSTLDGHPVSLLNTIIANNTIIDPANSGIQIGKSARASKIANLSIVGNIISGAGKAGIASFSASTSYPENTIIQTNIVRNCRTRGIMVRGGLRWLIANNIVTHNGVATEGAATGAIEVGSSTRATDVILNGNLVQANGYDGILVAGDPTTLIMSGNVATGNGTVTGRDANLSNATIERHTLAWGNRVGTVRAGGMPLETAP